MLNKTRSTPRLLALASTVAVVSVALSGCGQSQPSAPEAHSNTPSQTNSSENVVDQNALLEANDRLSAELADDYVQGWIQDGRLNVSTTNAAQTKAIEAEGAVAHVVQFSAEQLREGISKITKWQSQQDDVIRNSIHGYTLDPSSGGLILSVDPTHQQDVEAKLAKDKPAGEIPLGYQNSGGIATRAN